jgi:inner membrane protein
LENLTHSLVGAALAQAAAPRTLSASQHRLLIAAGLVSANLPDADLLYVGITPEPLGYLLHHRGHTHTVVGLAVQAVLLAGAFWLVPWLRHAPRGWGGRLAAVMGAGLLSHVPLDAANSYGVHPFAPFDARWFYGDAVFILEPWLWLLLGIPIAWSARRRLTRAAIALILVGLVAGMAAVGVLAGGTAAALSAGAVVIAALTYRLTVPARAQVALAGVVAFEILSFVLAGRARETAQEELRAHVHGDVVDIVLNPNPADPLCWMAIAVEKDEGAGAFALHTGTLSLAPSWHQPSGCASHRFTAGPDAAAGARASWNAPLWQPLARLRALAQDDCWTRAWLQFGRAPAFQGDRLVDLRFAQGARDNFTAMHVPGPRETCPAHVTGWAMPRADLLGGTAAAER